MKHMEYAVYKLQPAIRDNLKNTYASKFNREVKTKIVRVQAIHCRSRYLLAQKLFELRSVSEDFGNLALAISESQWTQEIK